MLKQIASAAFVAAATLGLVTAVTAPATADTVTGHWTCINAWGGVSGPFDYRITVTAPANATVGQTATVTAAFANTFNSGTHVSAGTYTGQLEIVVGGAGSGTLYANDMVNPDIPAGQPLRLEGGHAQITFNTRGDVTFKPQLIRIFGPPLMCGNSNTPIAATTHVS